MAPRQRSVQALDDVESAEESTMWKDVRGYESWAK